MEIWPAIDLRGGKCVRLYQGDFGAETVYDDDPVAVARRWQSHGAERLHIVDLDGARSGCASNREVIGLIASETGLPFQVGGGVRSESDIVALLSAGARRVVVGTRAVEDPAWFARMAERYPDRLVLGVDARDGRVAVAGWEEATAISAGDLVQRYAGLPLGAVVYTDIARDGTLVGPNVPAMEAMVSISPWPVVASGGVGCLGHISVLATTGVAGCIVGKALYEGAIQLKEALEAAIASASRRDH